MEALEGYDDCMKFFEKSPENIMDVTRKSLRRASRRCAANMKGKLPARWRGMVKSVVKTLPGGDLNASFGLYNGGQTGGRQPKNGKIFDWFKLYWANYGTLSRRDGSHHFDRPIKPDDSASAKGRRNSTGQNARNFFESAISGYEGTFTDEFNKALDDNIDKMYDR